MKRIKSKRNKTKLTVTVSVLVLALVASTLFYFYSTGDADNFKPGGKDTKPQSLTTKDRPVGEVNYSPPESSQENPSLDRNENSTIGAPPSTEGDDISVTLSYVGSSPLQVRVLIPELIQSGSCTLTLSKPGSAPVEQTVNIFPTANSTTCQGFTVDNELAPGTWKVVVTVSSGNRTGSATKDILL